MKNYPLLIDGKLIETANTVGVINPANEEIFATVTKAGEQELEAAISAAQKAFESYRHTSIEERQNLLKKISKVITENKEIIANALTLEQGKTLEAANMEVDFALAFNNHFASMTIESKVLIDNDEQRVETRHVPLGVVAGIMPWNFPFLISVYKLGPALLTGNSLILKPAQTTPISSAILGDIIKDVVPAGLVNILADDGELGAKITAHPGIAKVSFTGSSPTGRKIMESSAKTLKRLTLELGGNDAAIVLDDVDPKAIAEKIFGAAFINSGQVCVALKRLYVQENVYDEVCDEVSKLANAAVVGDGMDSASQFGPVQNKAQFDIVKGYIEHGRRDGVIIAGGDIPDKPGYFIPLTVVKDIKDGSPLVDEEPFGPVLPIIKFGTVEEAIASANSSEFGLGGSVWSKDLAKAQKIADQLDTGTVWINQHTVFGPHIPFGPTKQSGLGVEWGQEGLLEFTTIKVTNISKL